MPLETSYRYLNVAGAWPGLAGDLVADASGVLRLAPGPGIATQLVAVDLDPAGGLVGLAAARDGTLYVSDPGGGRVLRVDPCDDRMSALGCLDRSTGDPLAPYEPRGLALSDRDTLLVADAGGGRVLAVDRMTGVLVDVRDDFGVPWDVAVDVRGRVLVADPGAGMVRRFDAAGEDAAFAANVGGLAEPLVAPRAIAALADGAVAVVDGGPPGRVIALHEDGRRDDQLSAAFAALSAEEAVAIEYDASTLWAGGPAGLVALTGTTLARGEPPAVAGIARRPDARILFATGDGVFELAAGGAARSGSVVAPAPTGLLPWDRVRVMLAEPLPAGAHARVWTRTERAGAPPPAPPPSGDGPEAPQPSPVGRWRSAPLDVLDLRPLCEPADELWIAVELLSDGSASPAVEDMRVDRMGRGWMDELPHVLIDANADPLERLLALIASVYEDSAAAIDGLVERLDPAAAPDLAGEPWLARLASWIAIELPRRPAASERRQLVLGAVGVHERRGTALGIAEAVRREVGIDVEVVEPDPPADWTLGAEGLAFGTGLPAAPAGPAVLDTTAIVDRSWLIDPEERGLPLLGGVAHRFCVVGAAADLENPGVRASVCRVVEREKPAATVFDVSARPARTVVGAQARVGVDALTGPAKHGPAPGRVGLTSFIGDPDSERTVLGHD